MASRRTSRLSRLKESINASSPRSPVPHTTVTPAEGAAAGEHDAERAALDAGSTLTAAKRDLQERMYRLLLLPLMPKGVELVPVEEREVVGAPQEGSVEAAILLRRRVDAIE